MRRLWRCAGLAALLGSAALGQEGQIDLGPMIRAMENGGPPAETPPEAPAESPAEALAEAESGATPPAVLPSYDRGAGAAPAAGPAPALISPLMGEGPARIVRISGEAGAARFTFEVPDPAQVAELRLALRTSINNLAAQTRLTFVLNGQEIAQEVLEADAFTPLALPTDAVVAGRNTLELRVTQGHRIFCGPEASFAIWTEVDTGASGAVLAAPPGLDGGAAALALALRAGIVQTGRVAVDSAAPPDPALLHDLTQRIGALVPGAAPALVLSSPYAPAGGPPAPVRIALVAGLAGEAALRRGGDGALVLVLPADATAAMLDPWLPLPGPVADLPALVPGTAPTLDEIGLGGRVAESRYTLNALRFVLPDDWLLLAAQEARIDLSYRYAAGLPETAQMLVKVNGTTVRLLPLHGEGGLNLPVLPVGFQARLLAPGVNEVSFETFIPGDPPDLPCAQIPGPFVEISGETALVVPDSPAMTLPRLGTALRGVAPGGIAAIAGADPAGLAAQTVLALVETLQPLPGAGGATLTVAGLRSMDARPLAELGLGRSVVDGLLTPPLPAATAAEAAPPGWIARLRAGLVGMAVPGDPALDRWIRGRSGDALLFMPDADVPQDLHLIVSPGADPAAVARALSDARFDPRGPRGQVAILTRDGAWQSWQPATAVPRLHEPVTFANFRTIAGNYASWSPLGFVVALGALMSLSVVIALIFVSRTRGSRKR